MIKNNLFLGGLVLSIPLVLAGVPARSAPVSAPDIAQGQVFFQTRCMMCHTISAGKKGAMAPNLRGIGGTVSGVGDFAFSTPLKNAKIKWTSQTLEQFLTAPNKMVPGTRMITNIPDPVKRAQVVGYLMSLN